MRVEFRCQLLLHFLIQCLFCWFYLLDRIKINEKFSLDQTELNIVCKFCWVRYWRIFWVNQFRVFVVGDCSENWKNEENLRDPKEILENERESWDIEWKFERLWKIERKFANFRENFLTLRQREEHWEIEWKFERLRENLRI